MERAIDLQSLTLGRESIAQHPLLFTPLLHPIDMEGIVNTVPTAPHRLETLALSALDHRSASSSTCCTYPIQVIEVQVPVSHELMCCCTVIISSQEAYYSTSVLNWETRESESEMEGTEHGNAQETYSMNESQHRRFLRR